jgi:hypothetical protein
VFPDECAAEIAVLELMGESMEFGKVVRIVQTAQPRRLALPRAESKRSGLSREARKNNRGNDQQNRDYHHYVNHRNFG